MCCGNVLVKDVFNDDINGTDNCNASYCYSTTNFM